MSALVEAARPWRAVPGFLFGFAQPSLHGELLVADCGEEALHCIDEAFTALIGGLPQPWPGDAAGIVRRVLFWTVALQRSAGLAVSDFVRIGPPRPMEDGRTRIVVATADTSSGAGARTMSFVTRQVNRIAAQVGGAALADAFAPLRTALKSVAGQGQNTAPLLQAALALGLPVTRLTGNLVRLGWGSRQRLFISTCSDRTTVIGSMVARDKRATAALLRQVGLPGANHALARSADEAAGIAQRLGWPVVIKPMDRDGGIGVHAELPDEAAVREAFAQASEHSDNILVERHVPGIGHRLTVLNGRVVKATAKLPWGVTGDGSRTVAELVEEDLSARAARSAGEPRGHPALDEEALGLLRQHGLTRDSVPEAERFVALRRRNNAHAGGSTKRLPLDAVHPDNLQLALRAAEAVQLDIAGIDLIVGDIGRSWTAQPALICEVNAMPQSDAATLEQMLQEMTGPAGVRVPVWLLLLPGGAALPTAAQAAALATRLGADSWASPDAAVVAGERLVVQACENEAASVFTAAVLASPRAKSVMLLMTLPELLRHGLPVDRIAGCLLAAQVSALETLAQRLPPAPEPALHAEPAWAEAHRRQFAELENALRPHLAAL